MSRLVKFIGLLIALVVSPLAASARETVPLIDYIDVVVITGSGKQVTADQVHDAIMTAAKINRWIVSKAADQDVLSATLIVNNKHTVVISIPYSADKFSIKYQSSINMKYSVSTPPVEGSTDITRINVPAKSLPAGTPVIHPAYNKWVQALLQSIRLELTRL